MKMFDPLGDVKAAYEKTGLRPIDGWGDAVSNGCPLTAYGMARGCPHQNRLIDFLQRDMRFDFRIARGFYCGFDGDHEYLTRQGPCPQAYALGSLIRKALLP